MKNWIFYFAKTLRFNNLNWLNIINIQLLKIARSPKIRSLCFLGLFLLCHSLSFSEECFDFFEERNEENALFYDLAIAQYWDDKLRERLPITFNHHLSIGYFTTPSARMNEGGDIGFGFTSAPPYYFSSVRCQLFSHLEISTNFKVFRGVEDQGLSKHGYGDFSDRVANAKLAITTPEDSFNIFPGIAFGAEDFLGTKRFQTYYVVATKNWMSLNLETTIGWGNGRFSNPHSSGFFGGFAWFPFNRCDNPWIKGISLAAEYDPVDYENPEKEPHPNARVKNLAINYGAKYKIAEYLDFSFSYIRGDAFAIAGSINYNWGSTQGFVAKIDDPLPYCGPVFYEPLEQCAPNQDTIGCLTDAFSIQGLEIKKIWLENYVNLCGEEKIRMSIRLINLCYREEAVLRHRINCLVASFVPENVEEVTVILESVGLDCQQYYYCRQLLDLFAAKQIGNYEMEILTPMHNVTFPDYDSSVVVYEDPPKLCHIDLSPHVETFLNNAKGKFKYNLGIKADLEGLLPKDIYYELSCSYIPISKMGDINDYDAYNPSQLPNVQTDYVNYRKESAFTVDQAYLQKCWNMGEGWFSRLGGGYFEVMFGGIAGELLFYPANSNFAIGLEGAIIKKRRYHGLGFFNTIRRLKGYTPVYRHYTVLDQYFLDLYYDYQPMNVFFKISIGQFLAKDRGVRFQATRYFDSGLRLTAWYTMTNAGDIVNNQTYYDKGIAIEMPLEIFFKCRSRRVWSYGMAAWLRDSGAKSETGRTLFDFICLERR